MFTGPTPPCMQPFHFFHSGFTSCIVASKHDMPTLPVIMPIMPQMLICLSGMQAQSPSMASCLLSPCQVVNFLFFHLLMAHLPYSFALTCHPQLANARLSMLQLFAGPAAMAVAQPDRMIRNGQQQSQAQQLHDVEPTLPGQTDVQGNGPQIPAHQVRASPFQQLSLDRRSSWDEPHMDRHVPLDSAGNEQAPGANRQFSLELTTYASIPVRNTKSGFRPPHRSVQLLLGRLQACPLLLLCGHHQWIAAAKLPLSIP